MANQDKRISELPIATTPLSGSELIPVVQSGVTKYATISDLPSDTGPTGPTGSTGALGPTGPTGEVSSITGYTLSNFSSTKTLDAQSITIDELANIVATLIDELQN